MRHEANPIKAQDHHRACGGLEGSRIAHIEFDASTYRACFGGFAHDRRPGSIYAAWRGPREQRERPLLDSLFGPPIGPSSHKLDRIRVAIGLINRV